jgi:tetratricopeptide (TPR) repeat protein
MHPSLSARLRKATLSKPISPSLLGVLGVTTLLIALFLLWQLRPYALWAYNLWQAENYQKTAFTYPEPRQSDSLPGVTILESNQAALGHLAAAIQWRPDDPYAYRLAGESYLAAGDFLNAVNIMEIGLERAGSDILLGWQLALAYEQLHEQSEEEAGINLVSRFARATPDAPDVSVGTPFCRLNDNRSCYVGINEYTHPYAAYPLAGKVTANTLFLHPPARVTIPIEVPTGQPVLTFLMGLDPIAKSWGTDGATFQVWVVEPDGGILPVYERTIIGGELLKGWVPDHVDLTPWAGQTIQLAVGTTAGPLNDNTGDWVGFGAIYISDAKIAVYRALMPEGKFRDAILKAPILDTQLVGRGDEALYAARYEEAAKWYRRAEWMGADVTSTVAYAQYLEVESEDGFEAAFPYLEMAVKSDKGWGSPINRFYAYFNYGRWLTEEGVYEDSEGYLKVALSLFPNPDGALYTAISEVHRFLAIGYNEQDRLDEAMVHARQAVTLAPNNFLTQYQYGLALYRKDPLQIPEVEQAFARALELNQSANSWQTIILVWLTSGDNERTLAYCNKALQTYTSEQLGFTCWEGGGGASSILYNEYQQLLEAGDEVGAYAKLEEAITTNGGWSGAVQRFDTWLTWTNYLIEQERYEEVIPAAQTTLTLVPEYVPEYTILVLNQKIAFAYVQTERYAESLPYYQTLLSMAQSAFLYLDYGVALYYANPNDLNGIRTSFEQATSLAAPEEQMRALQIDFWYEVGELEEASRMCAILPLTSVEETICRANGATDSSGIAFKQYLDTIETDEDAALEQLERAVTLDSGWERLGYRHRAWYKWGEYLWEQQNYPLSEIALQNAVETKDPRVSDVSRAAAAALLASVYSANAQPDDAISAYEQAIDLDPKNAFAHVNLARSYYAKDNSDLVRVRALIKKAIDIDPTDADIWMASVGFWTFVNETSEVTRLCEQASDEIRNAIGGLCWDGNGIASRDSFAEFGRLFATDRVAAYQALEAAIRTDGGWVDGEERFMAWYYWGSYLLETQQTEMAVEALEMATTIMPITVTVRDQSEVFRQWGMALSLRGELIEGLSKAEEAIKLDSTNPLAHLLYGQLLYRTDTTQRSATEAAFAEALQIAPENTTLWISLVTFWLEQNVPDSALELCRSASPTILTVIEINCWDGSTPPSHTYYSDFLVQQASGNSSGAFIALESAINVDGGWNNSITRYLAWRDWASRLWQAGRNEEAFSAFQKTIDIAPSDIDPVLLAGDYGGLGFTLISLQQLPDAAEAFGQAVAIDPSNVTMRIQYGVTLYAIDPINKPQAVEQFAEALRLQPEQLSVWQDILGWWQRNGEVAEIESLCQQAQTTTFFADLASFCTAP